MSVDANTLVFFDASCLVAASGSPLGGSGFLLSICARGFLSGAVSQPVLLETERNVSEQLSPEALTTYHRLIATTPLLVVPLPSRKERRQYDLLVGRKDEHVLAAAIAAGAEFLLTLDKPLERKVNLADRAIRALSPGDFITTVLIEHVDYPRMR